MFLLVILSLQLLWRAVIVVLIVYSRLLYAVILELQMHRLWCIYFMSVTRPQRISAALQRYRRHWFYTFIYAVAAAVAIDVGFKGYKQPLGS